MSRDALPSYRDLPELDGLGVRHSRDVLALPKATLAFIETADIATAAASVIEGETIPINLPIDAFRPPLFGREALRHNVMQATRNDFEDALDGFNPQASSQLDGLAHVRARESGFFDGSAEVTDAQENLGMHHWASLGVAGRGVLLDLPSADPFDGSVIDPSDLTDAAAKQGVELRPGDVLLVRTGWVGAALSRSRESLDSNPYWRGLSASEGMAEFLWDHRIAIVGTDNPAVESSPGDPAVGSLHRRLLPALGLPMMELLALDRLAERCSELDRWSFLFVMVPLHVRGGLSSPSNAMAVF